MDNKAQLQANNERINVIAETLKNKSAGSGASIGSPMQNYKISMGKDEDGFDVLVLQETNETGEDIYAVGQNSESTLYIINP